MEMKIKAQNEKEHSKLEKAIEKLKNSYFIKGGDTTVKGSFVKGEEGFVVVDPANGSNIEKISEQTNKKKGEFLKANSNYVMLRLNKNIYMISYHTKK